MHLKLKGIAAVCMAALLCGCAETTRSKPLGSGDTAVSALISTPPPVKKSGFRTSL